MQTRILAALLLGCALAGTAAAETVIVDGHGRGRTLADADAQARHHHG